MASFLLALAFRDDVFDGITSPAQLWRQRVPEGDALLELRMKRSKLELPVLRTITRHGGLSNRMLDDSTFRYYFQRIVSNAGYYGTLTIHALRRALANAVDSEILHFPRLFHFHFFRPSFRFVNIIVRWLIPLVYFESERATSAERNQILGHSSSDMFGRGYISSISSVDGQAAFLREEARTDHIAKLRSVSTRRASGLPQKLPMKRTMDLLNDSRLCELYRHLCDLRDQGAPSEEIQAANRQFRIHRKWSKRTALDKWKEDWLDDRYQKTIKSGGTASHDKSTDANRVQALFRIMPERARLADMIVSDKIVTRNQNLLAVQDLLSLCQRDFAVMYRPGDEPIDNLCPVCQTQLPKNPRDRPDHIHNCRRDALKRTSVYVQYCFLCFRWFCDVVDWEEHCSKHLLSMNSVWCGIQVYCHTIISPGHCPFCLNNEQVSASNRLQAWTRNYLLMEHLENHIKKICWFNFKCPHPLCNTQVDNLDLFRHHLSDIHGLTRSQREAFDARRHADMTDTDLPSNTNTDVEPQITRRKKRKLSDRTETMFVAWSPSASLYSMPRKQSSARSKVFKLDSGNKRKAEEEELDCCVISNSSDSLSSVQSKLRSDESSLCDDLSDSYIELGQPDSSFNFDNEKDQVMGTLIPFSESSHAEIVKEPATKVQLYASSVSECNHIPIDPAILSENDSFVSNAFTQASQESIVAGRNSLTNPIVINEDTAEKTRAATPADQVRGSAPDQGRRDEEYLAISRFAHDGPRKISPQPTSKASSDGLSIKCPVCNHEVSRPTHSKPMKFSQQKAFCENHRKKEAQEEWTRLGYPRIAWRRLHLRLTKKASALREILTGCSFSFFRTELQAAVDRKEARKCRGIDNMTAGYYGPRGEQVM